MGVFKKAGGIALIGVAAPPLLMAKAHVWRKLKARQEERRRQLGANRLQFGQLPRARQRAVLYYRKQQLSDLQGIYKAGYKPKPRYRY